MTISLSDLRYVTDPSVADAWAYYRMLVDLGPDVLLCLDIETPESQSVDEDATDGFASTDIVQFQCSHAPGQAIAFPWRNGYCEVARAILKLPNPKCGHNWWLFDQKVLAAESRRTGVDYSHAGVFHDTLQMFHWWQPDLPAHLQFACSFIDFPFPWKHLHGANEPWYGCADVDSNRQLYGMLEATLRRDGLWDGYVSQVYEVRPVLAEMERRGVPIDDARRQALGVEFDAAQHEVDAELQADAPLACRKLAPKKSATVGYTNPPPKLKAIPEAEWEGLRGKDPDKVEDGVTKEGEWYTYRQLPFEEAALGPDGNPFMAKVERWVRVYDFNPNSWPQLIARMKAKGHPVPKSKKKENADGSAADTTEKKELQRLASKTGDPFYLKVIESRELGKAKGTYVEGFRPQADGWVHTTFTFDTGTGQLSCCAPWTPIRTYDGRSTPIKDIKVGALVWTHQRRWREVTAVWVHPQQPMVDVHLSNGRVLTCTTSHKLLAWGDEYSQKMDDQGEHSQDSEIVPEQRSPHSSVHLSEIGHLDPHDNLGAIPSDVFCGVWSVKKAALLTLEDRQEEPAIREAGARDPELGWRVQRWARVSDLLSRRHTGFCTSASDGTGARDKSERPATKLGSPPHRRGPNEQPLRQLSLSDECRPQVHSLVTTHRSQVVTIEKVVPVGSFPVHDITVAEDESYESCGVFSHNSRNPNVQNFPKHGRLASALRGMVAAPAGHVLTEWDYKAFHVMTTGFEADSLSWMRMARLDMHSFVAGVFLKHWTPAVMEEPDDALLDRFAWFKADPARKMVRDRQAKAADLGIGFGMGKRRLYQENLEHFPDERTAGRFIDILQGVFPEVICLCKGADREKVGGVTCRAWQHAVRLRAHDKRELVSRWGAVRRMYEVFVWNSKAGGYKKGDQAEEAVAFLPANDAHGEMRTRYKTLDASGMAERYGFMSSDHDSFKFCFPLPLLVEHIAEVGPLLAAPSQTLRSVLVPGGLQVDVELSVGPNWAEMRKRDVAVPTRVQEVAAV